MYTAFFVFVFLVTSPVLTAVVTEVADACRLDEYSCGDGACISLDHLCDGLSQCADGSDEMGCEAADSQSIVPSKNPTIRSKRQARECRLDEYSCGDGFCISLNHLCDGLAQCADFSDEKGCEVAPFQSVPSKRRRATRCRMDQWGCRDGTCISFDGKCDGTVDCPDGSDETFPLCRKTQCQSNWFRCTYGACVDGTAPCNGVQDCADNSDELLPRCRNETDEIRGQFRCANGNVISAAEHCDGMDDCGDASDETVRACSAKTCPSYLFQCAYGACVDQGADCNNAIECADGSDESDELCNRSGTGTTKRPPSPGGKCVLPPYPNHGRYEVGGVPNASPGQSFPSLQLNVSCNPGYGVIGDSSVYCYDGSWSSAEFPKCVRFCQLKPHPSVEYRCLVTNNGIEGTRDCSAQEPSGTVVVPKCRVPNYYFPGVLNHMQCIDGIWDYTAICNPGLAKNGTKITILIKDNVEFYITNLTYHVPLFNLPGQNLPENNLAGQNLPVNNLAGQKVSLSDLLNLTLPNFNISLTPDKSVEADSDYDIDKNDWRMGTPTNLNVNINNSTVHINARNVKVNRN